MTITRVLRRVRILLPVSWIRRAARHSLFYAYLGGVENRSCLFVSFMSSLERYNNIVILLYCNQFMFLFFVFYAYPLHPWSRKQVKDPLLYIPFPVRPPCPRTKTDTHYVHVMRAHGHVIARVLFGSTIVISIFISEHVL